MPFDEELAQRIRGILGRKRGITEKRMFGGLAFLLDGSIICSAKKDEMFVAVGEKAWEDALAKPGVRPMKRGAKPLAGYLYVKTSELGSDAALRRWIELGLAEAKAKGAR